MTRPKTPWEVRYMAAQARINECARRRWCPRLRPTEKIQILMEDQCYAYLRQHPCKDCRAATFCDNPCDVYLKWYNTRIASARVRAGMNWEEGKA